MERILKTFQPGKEPYLNALCQGSFHHLPERGKSDNNVYPLNHSIAAYIQTLLVGRTIPGNKGMNKDGSFSSVTEDGYGLSSAKAREILSHVGPNEIFQPQMISFSGIAKHEITEPMILLLLFVGVVYSIWGGIFDALTIFVIISLLVFVEVYNEFRAKNAIAALGQIASPTAAVLRDRVIIHIDPRELVPDDVIILNTGTKIPADAIIISSNGLQCDESALTGESVQVIKNEGDHLFAGTVIVSGEGSARIFATGKNTRLGQIARTAKDIRPPKTALQLAMKDLAGKLVYVAVFFCVLITVIGILRGGDIRTMVLTGLSLAFATIPEELPIIITMVLGIGAYQLSRHNFLIKKIKAAETLGNATVIVTDKTGTITEAKMKIAALYPENDRSIIAIADLCLPEFITSPLDEAIRERATDLGINGMKYQSEAVRDFGNGRKTRSVIRNTGQESHHFYDRGPGRNFQTVPGDPGWYRKGPPPGDRKGKAGNRCCLPCYRKRTRHIPF